jgi:hypothetical protein
MNLSEFNLLPPSTKECMFEFFKKIKPFCIGKMITTISLLFNCSTCNELSACRKIKNAIGLDSCVTREKYFLLLKYVLKIEKYTLLWKKFRARCTLI